MRVIFSEKNRDKVLASIQAAMGDRELGKIVRFAMGPATLQVTIAKLGTSTLEFAEKATAQGLEYTLATEKIAFTHKAFKDEVTKKIVHVIEKAGGKVS